MSFIKKKFIGKEIYGTVTTVKLVPKIEEALSALFLNFGISITPLVWR